MKKGFRVFFISLIALAVCLYSRAQITLVHEFPPAFDKSQYEVDLLRGATQIYKDKVLVDPIIHDKEMNLDQSYTMVANNPYVK